MPRSVSVIATVFNEAEGLAAWFDALDAQSAHADEVVVVDAGSTDGTIELLEQRARADARWRILVRPGANVPRGRNLAIEAATGDVIAVTDAGTIADRHWLAHLLRPFDDPGTGAVGGFFAPAGRTDFEYVVATIITPREPEIDAATFLPSSRSVAFRKEWWEKAGGYPDWLRAGEDLVFSQRLRDAGARVVFAPEAIVKWYPRPSLVAYMRQYRHYARGDGHAHMFFKRHAARYGAYVGGVALLAAATRRRSLLAPLAAGVGVHLRRHLWRVHAERPFAGAPVRTAWAYLLVPVVVVSGDLAKMRGFPQGLWERRLAGGAEELADAAISSHRRRGDDAKWRYQRPTS